TSTGSSVNCMVSPHTHTSKQPRQADEARQHRPHPSNRTPWLSSGPSASPSRPPSPPASRPSTSPSAAPTSPSSPNTSSTLCPAKRPTGRTISSSPARASCPSSSTPKWSSIPRAGNCSTNSKSRSTSLIHCPPLAFFNPFSHHRSTSNGSTRPAKKRP
ncbi:hypothetical protein PTTG_26740, partial [Puccinia triticina 1-1 BBBD Race 1]